MKYIIYITLFISGIAFAQGGNVVSITPDTLTNSPVITTTQKLQGSMPNAAIIRSQSYPELPKTIKGQLISFAPAGAGTFFNTYTLTQADKDSLYAAAFNGQIVQQAIKAKFNGKSKLFERGYETEFTSLLLNDSISIDDKKKLLVARILADRQYEERNGGTNREANGIVSINGTMHNVVNGRIDTSLPRREDRKAALKDFVEKSSLSFSKLLYNIDGAVYGAYTTQSLQALLKQIRVTNIASVQLLTDNAATAIHGYIGRNGVIIITVKH